MQNTLLGLGIALILALVTALAGPFFIDWGRYRAGFESEASRMAGLPVRIGGAIDVRILPTPTIVLRDVEVGARAAPVFGAQAAHVELSLGSLMRGEWRAAVLTLEAPDISLGLDAGGRIVARNVTPGIDLDRISIDQIVMTGGTLALEDASSRARTTLEKFSFDGEMRSFAGALKGEGGFVAGGKHYKFRLSSGRSDSGLRLHVNLDAQDRPLSLETDGALTFDGGVPHYEGSLVVLRPAGVQLENGKTVASDPWRVSGKIKADVHRALMEQIEFQYGPDERVIRMTGTAEMKFGANPDFNGVLSARQADLDRALTQSDAMSRLPLAMLRGLTESFGELGHPPMPVSLGIGIDSVTLSGATLQSVRGDIKFSGGAWSIENFEFRAPGLTQVALAGRFDATQDGAEFSGPVSVDSADPRALLAWLEGLERVRSPLAPLKLRGDLTAGRERLMIERVHAESDRKTFEGRLAYIYPRADRPAKLDAALTASEFDLDGAISFFNAALSGSSFARPGEIALAVDLGRTTLAGIAATSVKAGVRIDGTGVRIEKLSIGDFGGATVNASGQIDISATPPRGAISLSLGAQKIDGIVALVRKFSPDSANVLMRYATQLAPANLESSISIDPPSASGATVGRLAMNGRLGPLRLTMGGDITGTIDKWADSKIKMTTRIESEDGALLEMIGLDRALGEARRPATLVVAAGGPIGGDLDIESSLAGDGLEAHANGKLGLLGSSVSGTLAASITAADLRGLRRDALALPLVLKSTVKIADGVTAFGDIAGKVGTVGVRGQIFRNADGRISGNISADRVDIAALAAAAIGMPVAAKSGVWPTQPFAVSPLAGLRGKIDIAADDAILLPTLKIRKFGGVLGFAPSEVTFDNVAGATGKGTLAANASFKSGAAGLTATGTFKLTGVDADAVIQTSGKPSASGQLSSQVEFEGTGSTPASLVGALRGTGTVTLDKVQLPAVDDRAIDVAIRAIERGTPVTAQRISDVVTRVMDTGSYSISRITAPIEITAGRVRLGKVAMPARAGDLAVAGSLDLVEKTLDARLTLTGPDAGAAGSQRPEVSIALKGPLGAPQRTIDVSPLVGWLTLQAVDRESRKLEEAEREARRRERINAELEERMRHTAPQSPPSAGTAPVAPPVSLSPAITPPSAPVAPERGGSRMPQHKVFGIETAPLAPIAR